MFLHADNMLKLYSFLIIVFMNNVLILVNCFSFGGIGSVLL